MKYLTIAAILMFSSLALFACNDEESETSCTPGETRVCKCDNGDYGLATCVSGGDGWGSCVCSPDGDADPDSVDEVENRETPEEDAIDADDAVELEDESELAEESDIDQVDEDVAEQAEEGEVDQVDADESEQEMAACSNGERECQDSSVYACINEEWAFILDCAASNQECQNGECIAPADGDEDQEDNETCSDDDLRCIGNIVFLCQSGEWQQQEDCGTSHRVCSEGACTCTAGETRCIGDSIMTCTDNDWQETTDCSLESYTCHEAACVCVNDATTCQGDRVMTCIDHDWQETTDCSLENDTCYEGACVCINNAKTCQGDSVMTCTDHDWQETTDCSLEYKICSEGACMFPLCNDRTPCSDPDTYCFVPEAGPDGQCMPYCNLADTCPDDFTCDETSHTCSLKPGLCRDTSHCMADREFCDIVEGREYGVCKPLCYIPGEGCPPSSICCLQDSTLPECQGREGACISTEEVFSPCLSDNDCDAGNYCEIPAYQNSGLCKPECISDEDCPRGLVCRANGHCGAPASVSCDDPCPNGFVCDPHYNQCVLNCPACGPGECCDAQSAPQCYPCECINPIFCGPLIGRCCFGYTCSTMVYGALGYCI